MKTSLQSLRSIGGPLAASLAILESNSGALDQAVVAEAILQTWQRLAEDAVRGEALLSREYLANVHRQLATLTGGEAPGVFMDHGHPIAAGGQEMSWDLFLQEACGDEMIEPAWVLAQLRWGGHICSLSLSLGWLGMNIALIGSCGQAIVPPIPDHARLLQALDYAGPNLYDAENLRALIGVYAVNQGTTTRGVPSADLEER